jgi:NAD(P)-dependent dehydrogenase (short-subunit alcohol dehydrogenase family)
MAPAYPTSSPASSGSVRRKPGVAPALANSVLVGPGVPSGVAYTKALARQTIKKGIRANIVAPGPVWTVLQPSGGQPEEKVQRLGETSDFERPGQPAELAPVYVLLASQGGSFLNGEAYGVTGGRGVA